MTQTIKFARPVAAAFGLFALLGAIPAYAADVVNEEPPAPLPVEQAPLNTWSGPYAGVTLGYGFSGRAREPGNTIHTDGFLGSGFAGINGQSGQFVYGAEGDIGYSGVEGSNAGTKSRMGLEGSLRGRLGYAMTDRILVYGTGGAAAGRQKISEGGDSERKTQVGYTVGAGVDTMLTDKIFGRAEYRYTDFGSSDFGNAGHVSARDNRIQLGVGFKF